MNFFFRLAIFNLNKHLPQSKATAIITFRHQLRSSMEGGGESRINIPKEQLFADQKGRLTARHARRQSVISVKCFFHDDLAHTFDAAHVLLSGGA